MVVALRISFCSAAGERVPPMHGDHLAGGDNRSVALALPGSVGDDLCPIGAHLGDGFARLLGFSALRARERNCL